MLVIQFVHVSLVIMNAHVKVLESAIVTQVIALAILIDIAHAIPETVCVIPIGYVVVIVETVIVIHSVHVILCVLQRILVMGAHVKEIVQLMQQLVAVVCNTKI